MLHINPPPGYHAMTDLEAIVIPRGTLVALSWHGPWTPIMEEELGGVVPEDLQTYYCCPDETNESQS